MMTTYVFAAFDVVEEKYGFDGTMLILTEKPYWDAHCAQQDFEISNRSVLSFLSMLGFAAGDETTFEGTLSANETHKVLGESNLFEFDQSFYDFLAKYVS